MPPVVSAVEGGFTLVSRKKRKRSIRVVGVYVTAGYALKGKKVYLNTVPFLQTGGELKMLYFVKESGVLPHPDSDTQVLQA